VFTKKKPETWLAMPNNLIHQFSYNTDGYRPLLGSLIKFLLPGKKMCRRAPKRGLSSIFVEAIVAAPRWGLQLQYSAISAGKITILSKDRQSRLSRLLSIQFNMVRPRRSSAASEDSGMIAQDQVVNLTFSNPLVYLT
jgi:hypothetical protein